MVAKFPVTGQREFIIEVEAKRGVPGVYVISRLKNLGSLKSELYLWSWPNALDRYFVPGENGIQAETANTTYYDRTGRTDWVFVPGDRGGLAIFTSGTLAKGPKDSLRRSRGLSISRTDSLRDMGFRLVGAADANEAAKNLLRGGQQEAAALLVNRGGIKAPNIDYGHPAPAWARNLPDLRRHT